MEKEREGERKEQKRKEEEERGRIRHLTFAVLEMRPGWVKCSGGTILPLASTCCTHSPGIHAFSILSLTSFSLLFSAA